MIFKFKLKSRTNINFIIYFLIFLFSLSIFKSIFYPEKEDEKPSCDFYGSQNCFNIGHETKDVKPQNHEKRIQEKNIFVISVCSADDIDPTVDFKTLNTDQAIVLLKSAVALTSKTLRFVILTNHKNIFYSLLSKLNEIFRKEDWQKLILQNEQMRYPKDREYMRDLFKPCSTARLFVPNLIRYDSAIYLDTDTVFLRPPEDLWDQFSNFDDNDVAGMAQTRGWYNTILSDITFPFYGATGVNAGVLLMNLTRIDHFPSGWLPSHMKELDRYRNELQVGDQDLLNIVFSKKPDLLYELGCEWNFLGLFCDAGRVPCRRAEKYGISLIHGNSNTIYFWHFGIIFNGWKNYLMKTPLEDLWNKMDEDLKRVNPLECFRIDNLSEILTKWMKYNILFKRRLLLKGIRD